ncbi:fungal specific transcription factor [Fusarium longipes]|uniref:Fungal specific transcription factor n=1 Tax=Fusarium longipes TaxID=694270 RepID=A0A395T9D5_9HYPO|nr:fungal specific transcription factor [Fusarium longipes]
MEFDKTWTGDKSPRGTRIQGTTQSYSSLAVTQDRDKVTPVKEPNSGRAACFECARRKQKCNRVWPCNNCQKRNVANKCQFKPIAPQVSSRSKKRDAKPEVNEESEDVTDVDEPGAEELEALGYSSQHFFSKINHHAKEERPLPRHFRVKPDLCPQLRHALDILPPRPYIDSLVKNFVENVNFHYYIIYPATFLADYQDWWSDRSAGKPLDLQWTCLLLMICACSTQYLSSELQRKYELELGETAQKLTERYHRTSCELYSAVPSGQSQLLGVQQLLHSCYWYKSEARFTECWHVLGHAIREAQEMGIHQEAVMGDIPDFEREMHRRIWCVLDTWDWQMSALLSRPLIIDRTDCHVGLPSLTLEGITPSPLLHMKLQSEIIRNLFHRFGPPRNIVEPSDVQEYQKMLEDWMALFPPMFDLHNPDYSQDILHPWIPLHRHYLHTMGYSMILNPMRAFLAKPIDIKMASSAELHIRSDGIDYALKLMKSLGEFFSCVWPRDAKFHFVIFAIFDTAAVYSSVILHDKDDSAPKRQEMFQAFEEAMEMITQLKTIVPNARIYYKILVQLRKKMQGKGLEYSKTLQPLRKRAKMVPFEAPTPKSSPPEPVITLTAESSSSGHSSTIYPSVNHYSQKTSQLSECGTQPVPVAQPSDNIQLGSSRNDMYPGDGVSVTGEPLPSQVSGAENTVKSDAVVNLSHAIEQTVPVEMGLPTLSEEELTTLAEMWKWESLDLGLTDHPSGP